MFPDSKTNKPVVRFRRDVQKCAALGSILYWRKTTSLLRHQPVATFVLGTAYVGPFLSLTNQVTNQGFELVGDPGVGKSTMQRVAAAVCGPADSPLGQNYWITANATINGLDRVMAEHNDLTLIIEESNLFALADHAGLRGRKLNELVFRLGDGTEKLRFHTNSPSRSRFNFLTSTNEALADLLLNMRAAVADAASDRLLTIPIGPGRRYGIFDCLPEGYATSGALADELTSRIRKCHGVGIRKLLTGLTRDMAERPDWVRERLNEHIASFRKRVGVDGTDGSETRVADACGTVYAALMFAVSYGAISRHIKPLKAALEAYWLIQTTRAKPPEALELLLKMARCWDTIVVPHGTALVELSDAEIDQATAIVRQCRNGQWELLLTDRQLKRVFPHLPSFFADPQIKLRAIAEGGRKKTKRRIRDNREHDRFHCFTLTEEEARRAGL